MVRDFLSRLEKRKKSIIINFLNFKSVFEKQEICYNTYRVSSSYIFLYFPIFLATSYFLLYFREIPIFSYILEVLL